MVSPGPDNMIDLTVSGGGDISFNIQGISRVNEILTGLDMGTGYTSTELRYICGNPVTLAATTFFNGTPPCQEAARCRRAEWQAPTAGRLSSSIDHQAHPARWLRNFLRVVDPDRSKPHG
ncbi:hypothetical protein GCM10009665_22800 [Kitasatospora nipponensis]|uniref:Uncharacterized protein n=1 Tax=Kitasatospora nipponensis TaxID=258049 RepID=A0ABP4GNT0_9ACTN